VFIIDRSYQATLIFVRCWYQNYTVYTFYIHSPRIDKKLQVVRFTYWALVTSSGSKLPSEITHLFRHVARIPWTRYRPITKPLHTQKTKYVHAASGVQTQGSSVRAVSDIRASDHAVTGIGRNS